VAFGDFSASGDFGHVPADMLRLLRISKCQFGEPLQNRLLPPYAFLKLCVAHVQLVGFRRILGLPSAILVTVCTVSWDEMLLEIRLCNLGDKCNFLLLPA
jgi:hypothetical protein